jgi:S-(hydroxymethyl)glutathione dehydrogenase / alcohol dehydrogenase
MPTKSRAAVLFKRGEPLRIETIDVADPGPGEVLIKLAASGLCHSDLHLIEDKIEYGMPYPLPLVPGHEGMGIVVSAGQGAPVKEGDTVIPFLLPDCGECVFCKSGRTNLCAQLGRSARPGGKAYFTLKGRPVTAASGTGTFSEYVCVPGDQVVKVNPRATPDPCCCIACGVTTGVGSALLVAKVREGDAVVVFGAGGVGLSVIQGARIAGARTIIAVDMNAEKEAIARSMGATHFLHARNENLGADVVALTGMGADFAFDTVGTAQVVRQALASLHRGGWSEFIRIAMDQEPEAAFHLSEFGGKAFRGSLMGGAKRADVARFVDWYVEGKLSLDGFVSHRLRLDQINDGFDLMRQGKTARAVIVYD